MRMLADAGAVFVGQGVAADGVATFDSLDGIPFSQRIETPVVEELQVGMGIGLTLCGFLPVLVYPRFDFLLRAADQLVNHLDKLEEMSRGQFVPKVIIRTRVGNRSPLDPGPQHSQDHTEAFRLMLRTVDVRRISTPAEILPTYEAALAGDRSSLIVEAI
jgi:pyruvate/2-oxoglutarate/acetoin dehydrogenase E1 component